MNKPSTGYPIWTVYYCSSHARGTLVMGERARMPWGAHCGAFEENPNRCTFEPHGTVSAKDGFIPTFEFIHSFKHGTAPRYTRAYSQNGALVRSPNSIRRVLGD